MRRRIAVNPLRAALIVGKIVKSIALILFRSQNTHVRHNLL